MKFARPFLTVFMLTLPALVGCGEKLATVTGAVTLDGKPLAGGPELRGIVQFVPSNGSGAVALGYLDSSGVYSLASGSQNGIRPGSYLVTVAASKIIPPSSPGEAGSGRPATPRKYASAKDSGLTADVQPGKNTFDFALKSQGSG